MKNFNFFIQIYKWRHYGTQVTHQTPIRTYIKPLQPINSATIIHHVTFPKSQTYITKPPSCSFISNLPLRPLKKSHLSKSLLHQPPPYTPANPIPKTTSHLFLSPSFYTYIYTDDCVRSRARAKIILTSPLKTHYFPLPRTCALLALFLCKNLSSSLARIMVLRAFFLLPQDFSRLLFMRIYREAPLLDRLLHGLFVRCPRVRGLIVESARAMI